jgi:hypothetical protein
MPTPARVKVTITLPPRLVRWAKIHALRTSTHLQTLIEQALEERRKATTK